MMSYCPLILAQVVCVSKDHLKQEIKAYHDCLNGILNSLNTNAKPHGSSNTPQYTIK